MKPSVIIFTDLDGTLLDHHTYSFSGAFKALERLHLLSIPLVLCSSKTRPEILKLQQILGLNEPFISENGGGIFFPKGNSPPDSDNRLNVVQFGDYSGLVFGSAYATIRKVFEKFRDDYNLKGFGDMSIEEIMERTGLSLPDAELAAKRDFTEPFVFLAKPKPDVLAQELKTFGLKITRGGRFFHMMSASQDKGRAVHETVKYFQEINQESIISIALGDAQNDYLMFKAVDIPVLIPKPGGTYESMEIKGLRKAPQPGSSGWGIAVAEILDEFAKEK